MQPDLGNNQSAMMVSKPALMISTHAGSLSLFSSGTSLKELVSFVWRCRDCFSQAKAMTIR